MASGGGGGGIRGFYKQKKKNGGGVSKPSAASKKTTTTGKKRVGGSATLGSGNPRQTPALIAHGSYDLDDEYGEEETKLRKFDMEMRYGPCVGITRLQRWQRANSMGLNPPKEIEQILLRYSSSMAGSGSNNQSQLLECLWEGRA